MTSTCTLAHKENTKHLARGLKLVSSDICLMFHYVCDVTVLAVEAGLESLFFGKKKFLAFGFQCTKKACHKITTHEEHPIQYATFPSPPLYLNYD